MSLQTPYRVYERLHFAMTLTFIAGFVNAFTYITQDAKFATMQTGNVIGFGLRLATGDWQEAFGFLLPVFVFVFGQVVTYYLSRWSLQRQLDWHLIASFVLTAIAMVTILLTPFLPSFFTLSAMALFASVQVEAFKVLKGTSYANVMMTGNLKNVGYLLTKGMIEGDTLSQIAAINISMTIFSFVLGVISSSFFALHFDEYGLAPVLLPLFLLNYLLYQEKEPKN